MESGKCANLTAGKTVATVSAWQDKSEWHSRPTASILKNFDLWWAQARILFDPSHLRRVRERSRARRSYGHGERHGQ